MGQERLSYLALMHIHYQAKIVSDEVVNLFATKHPRRLELGTITIQYNTMFFILRGSIHD